MQGGINKTILSHPSDEELARFVDNQLDQASRDQIVQHLIKCDDCSDAVALVMKYGEKDPNEKKTPIMEESKKEQESVNSIGYKGGLGVLSGLVALFIIFIMPNSTSNQFSIGEIDLSKPIMQTMSSSPKHINKIINGDKVIKEIEKKLDKTALSSFLEAQKEEAQKEETQKNYDNALNLYKESFRDAITTFKGREKIKWQIIIYYHIARIKFERKDKDSDKYKRRVQFWIQQYVLGGKI